MRWIFPTPLNETSSHRRRKAALLVLCAAAFICLLTAIWVGGDVAPISAQISPLSPLYAVGSDSPALSLTGVSKVNVLASGQAGLTRLALVLVGIIVGASIFVWRRP